MPLLLELVWQFLILSPVWEFSSLCLRLTNKIVMRILGCIRFYDPMAKATKKAGPNMF